MTKQAFSTRVLPNGLTIMTVPREGTEAATVSFLFRGGSRYESPETNGLAHFNEHMVFKGGERYPDYRDVRKAFDQVGAVNNAYTGEEITGFWAKTPAAHILNVVDVWSDILTAAKYDPAELDKERGVIVEEINMYEDDPASDIQHVLEVVTFPDHPLGRPTLGPKENIRRFTPDDFRAYDRTHQTPDRCVLTIAGKLDGLDQAVLDGKLEAFTGSSDVAPEPARFKGDGPRLKLKHKETEQTHLAFALRGPSLRDEKRRAVFSMLAHVLGSASGRLFDEVREKRGLAYYVYAVPDQLTDAGILVVAAGVRNDQAVEATKAIVGELKRLRDGDLPDDELSVIRESLLGRLALRWEDSQALAEFYGRQQLLLGKVRATDELLKELKAVTAKEIVSLAKEIVRDDDLTMAAIGPQDEGKLKAELSFG
ncbi:MAG TPA: pitrilysin family protein [Patescibacteria group bacterium]|jgi:predicted Zn-dependent peptidase